MGQGMAQPSNYWLRQDKIHISLAINHLDQHIHCAFTG